MSSLSYHAIQQQYTEAMQYSGPEAIARLWIADRMADAERTAVITEAARGTRRMRPVILSLGGLLVRIGERLECAAAAHQGHEYA